MSPSWTLTTWQEKDVSNAVLVATGSVWACGAAVGNDHGHHSAAKNPTMATADAMPTTLQSMPARVGILTDHKVASGEGGGSRFRGCRTRKARLFSLGNDPCVRACSAGFRLVGSDSLEVPPGMFPRRFHIEDKNFRGAFWVVRYSEKRVEASASK